MHTTVSTRRLLLVPFSAPCVLAPAPEVTFSPQQVDGLSSQHKPPHLLPLIKRRIPMGVSIIGFTRRL